MERKGYLWFFLGLGSRLQVVASLSITEIIVLAAAPFIFFKNYERMKHDGIMPFFWLSLGVVIGCIIASISNNTHPQGVLRGLAVTCIISCSIIFSHWILRQDPMGFKWYILAIPLSALISTFVFKTEMEMATHGLSSEEIMSGSTYWITRLKPLVLAPTEGWYLQMPMLVNVLAPVLMAVFSILSSVSGRSAALTSLSFAMMVIIGGKTSTSMSRISRHFGWLCVLGLVFVGCVYWGYKTAASTGLLGEAARMKYERQTHGGQGGIGRLLLGGRGDSFIGLLACRDKPIVGWGPWAIDKNGYTEEFLEKYGTQEDIETLYKSMWLQSYNSGTNMRLISCHAYVTEFWCWYGIMGLIFWVYVIFTYLRYLRQDVAVVPNWFGWLACSIPGMFWGIFFSPLTDRFGIPLVVVACLMARAVRKGWWHLPEEMVHEIQKAELK